MSVPALAEKQEPRARRVLLKARCEQQREELAQQIAQFESRLRGTDAALDSVRSAFTKPAMLTGAAALLLTMGRSGWWPLLSRGVVLFATGRRLYNAFRRK